MGTGARVSIVLKYLVLFLLVGPPVGALAFFVAMGVFSMLQSGDVSGLLWMPMFGIIYAVPFSYLIGAVPAGIAGLTLGAKAALHRPPGFLFAILTGLVVGVGLLYAGGRRVVGQGSDTVATGFLLATCLAATIVCWAFARGLIRQRKPSPPTSARDAAA